MRVLGAIGNVTLWILVWAIIVSLCIAAIPFFLVAGLWMGARA